MRYGHFDDADRSFVVTDPVTPHPWINYLGNRRLKAFVSQNAGGLLWYLEPFSRRISRYHYVPAPGDRPGCYVYVRDDASGTVWNPHFAPTCTALDDFACRHGLGVSSFTGRKDGLVVTVSYFIPPTDDVMLWQVSVTNTRTTAARLTLTSYLEFGLLEYLREVLAWCYLKAHNRFSYDAASRSIRYDYRVFEAPYTPRMAFGCTAEVAAWECSRDAFTGRAGSLERPQAVAAGATNSELPLGGHGTGSLQVALDLPPGASREFAYVFALAEEWSAIDERLAHYRQPGAVTAARTATKHWWRERVERCQVATGDAAVDRFVNTWNPYTCLITLDLARTISTDHTGLDGLRYRDTTQDALAVANLDPAFARQRLHQVFATQTPDGGGCFAFYPDTRRPIADEPHRSDNTVWQVYTLTNLLAETGDRALLEEEAPFRDGSRGSLYDHTLRGLRHIWARRGPHGLPTLFHADWNDGLALFQDEQAESVMLAMQLVYSCRQFLPLAELVGDADAAAWCRQVRDELSTILNEAPCWDGGWYTRLLLSSGKVLGSASRREGRIYLNPQAWAVIAGVGEFEYRGRTAMSAAAAQLDTPWGMRLLAPPYTGIPEPEDPPLGSRPGTNENGAIFCHANTWAIIAEALLGHADRAWQLYRQLLPEQVIALVGDDHYAREPYTYVSSITGPPSDRAGSGGISWLTGTASWMYVAATHYLLGVRPTLAGLELHPCLPADLPRVTVRRRFRGCDYRLTLERTGSRGLTVDGQPVAGPLVPLSGRAECHVRATC